MKTIISEYNSNKEILDQLYTESHLPHERVIKMLEFILKEHQNNLLYAMCLAYNMDREILHK